MTDWDLARVAVGRLTQIVDALDEYDPRVEIIGRVTRRFEAEATDWPVEESEVAENLLLDRTCETCAFLRRTSRIENRTLVLVAELCGGTAGRALPEVKTCGGWRGGSRRK
jgi:hypothetical protein